MYDSGSCMDDRYGSDDRCWVNDSGVYDWVRFDENWGWVSDDRSVFNDYRGGMDYRCVHNCGCWVNGESYWSNNSGGGYGQEG